MAEQSTNKFTWVIENFSEIKDEAVSPLFTIDGCNWRLYAYLQGKDTDPNHLAVYLDTANSKSLSSQWKIRAWFALSIVNQFYGTEAYRQREEDWFSANETSYGFPDLIPLTELKNKRKGFLLNDSVIIEAKIKVREVHGNLDITAEGVDAEETSSDESEGDSTDCPSDPSVDAEEFEICEEVSSSKNPLQLLDGYETIEAAKSDVHTSKGSPIKTGLIFQTVNVNGFLVHHTQAERVEKIFEKHPDVASNFRPKSHQLRTAYMNVLLDLIEALCRSPQDITKDDLRKVLNMLIDLEDAGFKLDWLKASFDEVSKRKERAGGALIGELEKEFEKLKLMMSDLEAKLVNEKEEVEALKAPLSFNDLVSKSF